jgi:hypothetical protein
MRNYNMNNTKSQVLICTSFEWGCKALKGLQVTCLKVGIPGKGCGTGNRENREKRVRQEDQGRVTTCALQKRYAAPAS